MKILHIATELQKASGITTFVENVAEELRAEGHGVDCIDVRDVVGVKNGEITLSSTSTSNLNLSSYDIVHLHGLWRPMLHKIASSITTSRTSQTSQTSSSSHLPRLVWSPHGMLQKWALKNKWWKKLAGLALYQWWDLRRADLLHVTADSEVADVRRLALPNPLVLAPLGVKTGAECQVPRATFGTVGAEGAEVRYPPSEASPEGKPIWGAKGYVGIPTRDPEEYPPSEASCEAGAMRGELPARRTLLFVSRIQRKKGLPNLITAWSRLPEDLRTAWTIRIVGPDQDNHTAELMAQCDRLDLSYSDQGGNIHSTPTPSLYTSPRPTVEFAGAKYDADLAAEYASADLFVLPTHSENFGSVVIEALAHEVPVICTKAAPWSELESEKCGWWVDDSVDALTTCLRSALTTPPSTLAQMGARGRSLVESKYTWRAVASRLSTAYSSL